MSGTRLSSGSTLPGRHQIFLVKIKYSGHPGFDRQYQKLGYLQHNLTSENITKISSFLVCAVSRWKIEQLGSSFGFLFFFLWDQSVDMFIITLENPQPTELNDSCQLNNYYTFLYLWLKYNDNKPTKQTNFKLTTNRDKIIMPCAILNIFVFFNEFLKRDRHMELMRIRRFISGLQSFNSLTSDFVVLLRKQQGIMNITVMSRIIYFYFTNHPVLLILEKSLSQTPDSNWGFPKTENMRVKTDQKN